MTSIMCLHCSMQEEGILEHTNVKFVTSVISVHFSQLVDHCVPMARR